MTNQRRFTDQTLHQQLKHSVGDKSHIREYGLMGSGPQRDLPLDDIIYDVLAWLRHHSDQVADATGCEHPSLRRMIDVLTGALQTPPHLRG